MKTFYKETSRKVYFDFGGVIFMTNKDWSNKELVDISTIFLHDQQKLRIFQSGEWLYLGDYDSVDEAYTEFILLAKASALVRKVELDLTKRLSADKFKKTLDHLLSLDVIPATIPNITIILKYLNSQNWGSWRLPNFSVSYKVLQFDCDGVLATTIEFSKTIVDPEYPLYSSKKFKVGGGRGYLTSFVSLR